MVELKKQLGLGRSNAFYRGVYTLNKNTFRHIWIGLIYQTLHNTNIEMMKTYQHFKLYPD